ncbi:MAG: SDR family NAD(P)-dependent oxidoreductase [bacterium]|nr:SDR family NAD(P)-dependent oxidoreductase [bacterium]
MPKQQSGRTTLITGGTGALGRALLEAFLADGDRVVLPWIDKDEVECVHSAHSAEVDAGRLMLFEADVAESADARELVRVAGEVHVLVNGVGGFGGGAPVHETDLELWDAMYRINVRTVAAMSAAVVPGMIARVSGSIVNIASQAALDCPAGIAAYSASKASLVALTRSLQNELAGSGVRVNAVVPTTIDTPANRAAMPDADFSTWTAPGEIASVIQWLSSDAAISVRGALIPV